MKIFFANIIKKNNIKAYLYSVYFLLIFNK